MTSTTEPATIIEPPIKQPNGTEPVVKKKKVRNYINNKDLLHQFKLSRDINQMTPEFSNMLMTLCTRYGTKGSYVSYTYNEDMRAYAMMMLVHTWTRFNPDRQEIPNPFAFYTQCIKNSFKQYLKIEKRHRNIRDKLLVEHGMAPSHSYQIDHSNSLEDPNDSYNGPLSDNDEYSSDSDSVEGVSDSGTYDQLF